MDELFENEKRENISKLGCSKELRERSIEWIEKASRYHYSYHFTWLGLPIIQFPQDIVAMQEIIWSVQPDLIIETGIARGGSLLLWASLLELNAICGGPAQASVLGIDIDVRKPNREAIEAHPLSSRIAMLEGSSIDAGIVAEVRKQAAGQSKVLVCLDSMHTHQHVRDELEAYAPLVSVGSYCVVFDTIIEDLPAELFPNRPWGPGDNPKTAVWDYTCRHPEFQIDRQVHEKLLITVAPDGYLRRVA